MLPNGHVGEMDDALGALARYFANPLMRADLTERGDLLMRRAPKKEDVSGLGVTTDEMPDYLECKK